MFHSNSSSSSFGYPYSSSTFSTSLPSNYSSYSNNSDSYLHRSSSTHSLNYNNNNNNSSLMPPSSSSSALCDFLDFHSEPVRRVFSTGDLQGINGGQVSSMETCGQEGAAVAGRVGRYSAEERKERIERYRNKRNHRNFHKKITYACRKTLADSRPRVRGRFARNGETETENEAEAEVETEVADYNSFECYNYNNCHSNSNYSNYDSSSYNNCNSNSSYNNNNNCHSNNSYDNCDNSGGGGDWWRQMQAALTTTDEEECCYDEQMWAGLESVFSVNLLS